MNKCLKRNYSCRIYSSQTLGNKRIKLLLNLLSQLLQEDAALKDFVILPSAFWSPSRSPELRIGLGTEFRSEKIPRNRLGTVSVIPRKKVPIPRHSEFRGRANSEARNGTKRNGIPRKNEVLRNLHGLYDHFDNLDSDLLPSETFCGNFTGLRFIPVC